MNEESVFIGAVGVISATGRDTANTIQVVETIRKASQSIAPFPVAVTRSLKVGVGALGGRAGVPRRHPLARKATGQAPSEAVGTRSEAVAAGGTAARIVA